MKRWDESAKVVIVRLKIGAKSARVDQPLVGGASSLPDWAIVEMVVQNSKSQVGVPIVPGGGD